MTDRNHCREHSGVEKAIETLESQAGNLFKKLDGIGRQQNIILGGLVVTFMGVITTLLIILAQR